MGRQNINDKLCKSWVSLSGPPSGVILCPRRHLEIYGDMFSCHDWGDGCYRHSPGQRPGVWAEARGVSQHPMRHRTAPTAKNYAAKSASGRWENWFRSMYHCPSHSNIKSPILWCLCKPCAESLDSFKQDTLTLFPGKMLWPLKLSLKSLWMKNPSLLSQLTKGKDLPFMPLWRHWASLSLILWLQRLATESSLRQCHMHRLVKQQKPLPLLTYLLTSSWFSFYHFTENGARDFWGCFLKDEFPLQRGLKWHQCVSGASGTCLVCDSWWVTSHTQH